MKKFIFVLLFWIILPDIFIAQKKDQAYFPDLIGSWLSENKKQKVRVSYDQSKKMYAGKIEWLYEDDASQGRKFLDVNNPNPKLKTRRLTGINLIHSLRYEGNSVFRGYIYDPVSGKDYRCVLKLRPDRKTCEIRGYIILPWIGRTEIATKVSN